MDAQMNKETHNGSGGNNERKSKRGGSEAVGMTGEAGGWAEPNRPHQHQKLRVSRTPTGAWQRGGSGRKERKHC